MRRSAFFALAMLGTSLAAHAPAQAAKLIAAKASPQPGGYGRIVLTFDAPVGVKARLAGSILVLSFGEAVSAGPDRIASGLPDYVSQVRRDPDGSALRLALQRPYRPSIQEAGEQVFIDLLPDGWRGLPPPLPPEVVTELARRAREAEAVLKVRNPPPVPRTLPLELSHGPNRTRLSLRLPPEAGAKIDEVKSDEAKIDGAGTATRVSVPGAWRFDEQSVRGRLEAETGHLAIENGSDGARLVARPAEGMRVAVERDGDTLTLDFVPVKAPPANVAAKIAAKVEEGQPAAPEKSTEPAPRTAAPAAVPTPVKPEPAAETPALRRAGSGLVFPFGQMPPAALFERAGVATLVFETAEPVAVPTGAANGLKALGAARRVGPVSVLRFAVPEGRLVDLLPVSEPKGWELVADDGLVPSETLVAQRSAGAKARAGIGVKLPEPGAATWLDLDGERIAVVTARGLRRASVPKPQRFVEFELLTSRVGLAVLAVSDGLTVRPDLDGVAIGGERDLTLSGPVRAPEPQVEAPSDLAIDRSAWEAARRGDVRTMLREKFDAAVSAERRERGGLRTALAVAMMANGLDAEAVGALAAAAADDPVVESDPRTTLLRGIAAARMGRAAEAEALLSAETVSRNPEARLWRGYARAAAGRWNDADGDLRAGAWVIERYPEDIAATLQTAAAEAAAEMGDWDAAARAAKAAGRPENAPLRARLALLQARIDEGRGADAAALEGYGALAQSLEQPVAAAATLQGALLGLTAKTVTVPEAIDRLETLALTWHGGRTEAGTLAALGRLYEEAGQWRRVFATVRRADALAPEAASTRRLHEGAVALFEDLFLGERAGRIGGIEALALYFDYKDFAPAGRRGDEIVRRLADRLVALDLLDSAEELLQHQIEHRLTGAARAAVAARLATIRLMAGKPLEALQALDTSHVPELAEEVRRARALLRARALSDLTRSDLALETIEGETGADAERLRADILWTARRWREAGEAHEAMLGGAWRERGPLDDAARADVIRAGIAYGLAGEAIGLERLKTKFAPGMAESADARTFALLTRPNAPKNPAFRDIVRGATTAETLAAFLDEYRKRYPQMAVPARGSDPGRAEAANEARAPG